MLICGQNLYQIHFVLPPSPGFPSSGNPHKMFSKPVIQINKYTWGTFTGLGAEVTKQSVQWGKLKKMGK